MEKKGNNTLKVVVADSSVILRSGITTVLKRMHNYTFVINEIANYETLIMFIRLHTPELLIINPMFSSSFNVSSFKKDYPQVKVIALLNNFIDSKSLADFDTSISVYDESETIDKKITDLIFAPDDSEDTEQLSSREKEIIGCVVKGLTNKAIADLLSISIHTVITHRRNISRKLQIHSSAGLAIYAIVNKIVEINDIKA